MKKCLFIAALAIGFSNFCNAQSAKRSWSLEFNLGQNNAIRPFEEGYTSSTSGGFSSLKLDHVDLGVRCMLTEIVGLKGDVAYDGIRNSGTSLSFKTNQYRLGVQAVFDLGKVFEFRDFSNSIGLLLHAGPQVSILKPDGKSSELNRGLMIGITPEVRITDHIALTADFTTIKNRSQHYNWNGTASSLNNSLDGLMYTTSIGITYYIGGRPQ